MLPPIHAGDKPAIVALGGWGAMSDLQPGLQAAIEQVLELISYLCVRRARCAITSTRDECAEKASGLTADG